MVAEQEPVSPRLLNASVPRDLETICLKCLEKDPNRRYASAQELADELDRFLQQRTDPRAPIGRCPEGSPLVSAQQAAGRGGHGGSGPAAGGGHRFADRTNSN